ncbi:MAG: short-chain dehydrogenase [Phycisphaerales bacterium]
MVVGGTGMLAGVCRELAERGCLLSVLARRQADLGPGVTCYPCDYTDPDSFKSAADSAIRQTGKPSLLITWIHSTAPLAADLIHSWTTPTRHIRVLGSASANKPAPDLSEAGVEQVVLGFVVNQTGSRWLTHDEICEGVMRAVDHPQRRTVVGELEPREKRP